VHYGEADLLGDVHGCQLGALLVAGGAAGTALLAGIGNKHLVLAVLAAHPGEALLQILAHGRSFVALFLRSRPVVNNYIRKKMRKNLGWIG
jgi:hypothetical protein